MNHVDTTKTTTHISLCAGYGGIDIGLKRAIPSLLTVAFSEIEAFACANLVSKMEAGLLDAAPIWSNLKTFPWEEFRGKVDILSGGYPCQPFSAAGKRLGTEDPRHLWPYIAKGIAIMQPRVCFFENVEGHISLGLRAIIEDLGRLGYATAWGIFSAAEVGAPHQRKRIFILAHSNSKRGCLRETYGKNAENVEQSSAMLWPSRPGQAQHKWEPPRVAGNASSAGLERGQQSEATWLATNSASPASGDWQAQSALGGDIDGIASRLDYAQLCVTNDNRTDELRLLGNGVVPATAEVAFKTLMNQLAA